jgi:large subunit ribosomal protein L10
MPNAKKEALVSELTERMQTAKAVVFTDYRGLTVAQVQALRKELAKHNATIEVTKNTLLAIAAKQAKREVPAGILEGPTATLFAFGDEVSPIKALVAFAKEQELPTVKAGFLGDGALTKAQVVALAALPGREVLLGQLVGTIAAPLSGFVNVLQGNIRGLVYALAAVRDQKQS